MDRIVLHKASIGVFMGGLSEEREISIKSGSAIASALRNAGCAVKEIVVEQETEAYIAQTVHTQGISMAFIAMHGGFGEDGRIQAIFERMKFPYTGSGPLASQNAMDKIIFKKIMHEHQILTPDFIAVNKENYRNSLGSWSTFPCVIKPHASGSSKGVHLALDKRALLDYAEDILVSSRWSLVETYIKGKEITVGILGKKALTPIEIIPLSSSFFDYQSKYTKGATKYCIPAQISSENAERMKQLAVAVHQLLGCSDLSRIDFLLDAENNPYVLELNSIPGFTSQSLLPLAARYEGITFEQLCESIAAEACYGKNHGEKDCKRYPQTETSRTAS